jgi:sarcosine oxidase subunit beta
VVSGERRFAAKQLGSGRVLASDLGAAGDPVQHSQRWRRTVRAGIEELLPALEHVDFTLLLSGDYDVTPDRQPLLGPVGGDGGPWVAAGFSGHGFMLAPAIARMLADGLTGGDVDPALAQLAPGRFEAGRAIPEPQVV